MYVHDLLFIVLELAYDKLFLRDWAKLSRVCKEWKKEIKILDEIQSVKPTISIWKDVRMENLSLIGDRLFIYGNYIKPKYAKSPWCPKFCNLNYPLRTNELQIASLISLFPCDLFPIPEEIKKMLTTSCKSFTFNWASFQTWIELTHKSKFGNQWIEFVVDQWFTYSDFRIECFDGLEEIYKFYPQIDELVARKVNQHRGQKWRCFWSQHFYNLGRFSLIEGVHQVWNLVRKISLPKYKDQIKFVIWDIMEDINLDESFIRMYCRKKKIKLCK